MSLFKRWDDEICRLSCDDKENGTRISNRLKAAHVLHIFGTHQYTSIQCVFLHISAQCADAFGCIHVVFLH